LLPSKADAQRTVLERRKTVDTLHKQRQKGE
jgi:hypothetical protein